MPSKRMLIDAAHPEETRVVVIDGSRLEEYDVEVASRRQLKGNIYLAKITRVEPSLQAAFVDYGGNRHGFLAFNEIHPDYYQIPVADRERLLAEEAALVREAEARAAAEEGEDGEGGIDDDDDLERRHLRLPSRHYKIQEVIKRRQIMLVQVAKEERGNKGAALTTYLSLAGRYCVLMPNTARGGGISRKITNVTDRKRLKKILADLDVPEGMAVIVRTAGAGRSKAEIKRDYEYLIRLWSSIRETTLGSTAPSLVYEEGSLIKRSIRDHYEREIEEIVIQGEPEYKIAREFMKLFIPSHAKRVKPYEEAERPLFQAYNVEDQLDAMHQPVVQLRSGGYLVINPTEALVTIDVNSGRSTRERHIEETALRTNLEASDEIARQLRLRDLAGLIVIDFIDMEVPRNQGLVERRLKDAMKGDRARTQIGRISPFGLLELSRQRLRPSLLETSFEVCSHCRGSGVRRSTESTALAVLRKIEEEGSKHRAAEIEVAIPPAVAMYLLNHKRRSLVTIEDRFDILVSISADDSLIPPDCRIERLRLAGARADEGAAISAEPVEDGVVEEATESPGEREESAKRGRRRRGRRRRRPEDEAAQTEIAGVDAELESSAVEFAEDEPGDDEEALAAEDVGEGEAEGEDEPDAEHPAEPAKKRRRRGKRGGRRRSRRTGERESELSEGADRPDGDTDDDQPIAAASADSAEFADPDADDEDLDAAWALVDGSDDADEAATVDVVAIDTDDAGETGVDAAEGTEAESAKRPRTRRRTSRSRKAVDTVEPAEASSPDEPSSADAVAEDVVVEQSETAFVPDYRDRAVTGESPRMAEADPLLPEQAAKVAPEPGSESASEGAFEPGAEPTPAFASDALAQSQPEVAAAEPTVEEPSPQHASIPEPVPFAQLIEAVGSDAASLPAATAEPEHIAAVSMHSSDAVTREDATAGTGASENDGSEIGTTDAGTPDAGTADISSREIVATDPEPREASEDGTEAREDLRRTEVVHVGEDSDEDRNESRRGWWSRFLT